MTKKILFNISNTVLKSLLEVVLSKNTNINFENYYHTIEQLNSEKNYLITDDIFDLSQENLESMPFEKVFFIAQKSESKSEKVIHLCPSNCTKKIISFFTGNELDENSTDAFAQQIFHSIPIDLLKDITNAPSTLFIKIRKSGHDQYVKRFNRDEPLDKHSLESYISKGESKLYYKNIESDLIEEFFKTLYVDTVFNEISSRNLNKNTQAVKYMFQEFGISNDSCEFVNTLSSSIVQSIHQDESSSIIKSALIEKGDLYYKKSLITTTIAASIMKSLSWGNQDHIEKIAKLTLLADVFLDEKLCLINTQEKLLKSNFSKEKKDLVLGHALHAFENFSKAGYLDEELLSLIKIHHGKEDGIGFTDKLPQNTSPLLMVYRVSEDFAIELIEEAKNNNFNVIKIYENIKEMHHNLSHQDIIKQAFFSIYALMKTAA